MHSGIGYRSSILCIVGVGVLECLGLKACESKVSIQHSPLTKLATRATSPNRYALNPKNNYASVPLSPQPQCRKSSRVNGLKNGPVLQTCDSSSCLLAPRFIALNPSVPTLEATSSKALHPSPVSTVTHLSHKSQIPVRRQPMTNPQTPNPNGLGFRV